MMNHQKPIEQYLSIEMKDNNFPFGQLQQAPNQQQIVLVRKQLTYQNQQEMQILQMMSTFLKKLQNNYLISLVGTRKTKQNQYDFYYEYVPLTLEKWILELGEQLMQQLQFQMLNLTSYLTQNGIKFKFNHKNIGLSKQIKLKYFLDEFSIDHEKKMSNFRQISQQIQQFFTYFRNTQQSKFDQYDKNSFMIDRKSADCANLTGSEGTRQSWQVKSNKSANSGKMKMHISENISEKLQNSKKKSLQILQKLRNMKSSKQIKE